MGRVGRRGVGVPRLRTGRRARGAEPGRRLERGAPRAQAGARGTRRARRAHRRLLPEQPTAGAALSLSRPPPQTRHVGCCWGSRQLSQSALSRAAGEAHHVGALHRGANLLVALLRRLLAQLRLAARACGHR